METEELFDFAPEAILNATELTRQEKIARLQALAYDARQLQVAVEEGMLGPSPDLARILKALRKLGDGTGP